MKNYITGVFRFRAAGDGCLGGSSPPSGHELHRSSFIVHRWSIAHYFRRAGLSLRNPAGIFAHCCAALLLFALTLHAQVRNIVSLDYSVDGGAFTNVDVADAPSVNWLQSIPTTGLLDGLHRVHVRGTDDLGRTGVVGDGLFGTLSNNFTGATRVITQLEYSVDGGAFTNADVTDAASVSWLQSIPTTGLLDGLHRVHVRGTDDLGRTGVVTDGYFGTISNNFSGQNRLVTTLEYRIDSDPYTVVDVADAGLVNWNQLLSTSALAIGLHRLDVRCTDDLSRIGQPSRAIFIATSPIVAGQPRTITAAEYWVNTDPGPGNGVAIPLPNDGAYDESAEDVDTVLTGLPIGLHRVGFRTKDDLNRWSSPVIDSLVVGPVLVVHSVGSNLVLDWQSGPGVTQFKIYRSTLPTTGFALIDSTAASTYTDVGIAASQLKEYYRVTFETSGFSPFSIPEHRPLRD